MGIVFICILLVHSIKRSFEKSFGKIPACFGKILQIVGNVIQKKIFIKDTSVVL